MYRKFFRTRVVEGFCCCTFQIQRPPLILIPSCVLNKFGPENEKKYIFELENGSIFEIHNENLSEEKIKEPKDTSVKEVDGKKTLPF